MATLRRPLTQNARDEQVNPNTGGETTRAMSTPVPNRLPGDDSPLAAAPVGGEWIPGTGESPRERDPRLPQQPSPEARMGGGGMQDNYSTPTREAFPNPVSANLANPFSSPSPSMMAQPRPPLGGGLLGSAGGLLGGGLGVPGGRNQGEEVPSDLLFMLTQLINQGQ